MDWGDLYAAIAEKSGWTPDVISRLNLDTLPLLINSWNKMLSGQPEKKPASISDVLQFQALANSEK